MKGLSGIKYLNRLGKILTMLLTISVKHGY